MITNVGKDILIKFLNSQTYSYASHLAFGCGPTALSNTSGLGDYSKKTNLDLEMFRVPIISKGVSIESTSSAITAVSASTPASGSVTYTCANVLGIGDSVTVSGITTTTGYNGTYTVTACTPTTFTVTNSTTGTAGLSSAIATYNVSKIVFTAELPTQQRYGITEIGVYPSEKNTLAAMDSKNIFDFSQTEGWSIHDNSAINFSSINGLSAYLTSMAYVSAKDDYLSVTSTQGLRNEGFRYLSDKFVVKSNLSDFSSSSNYITISTNVDLSKASNSDKLILGLTLISNSTSNIDTVNVKYLIQFIGPNGISTNNYIQIANDSSLSSLNPKTISGITSSNRYIVSEILISDLKQGINFTESSWQGIQEIRIYANAMVGASYWDGWIGFDLLRYENISDDLMNPLYGLVGYTVAKNTTSAQTPIIKDENTSSFAEFKFLMGVK